jgi:hypothetical protein
MEYLLLIFSFAAVVVGIRGNTYNKNAKKWYRKVTTIGWLVVLLALIASGISARQLYKKDQQLESLERNRNRMLKSAIGELQTLLGGLEFQNKLLLFNSLNDTVSVIEFTMGKDSTAFRKKFETLNILEDSNIMPKANWGELVCKTNYESREVLNELWIKYSPYLDIETIQILDDLLHDPYLKISAAMKSFTNLSGNPSQQEVEIVSHILFKSKDAQRNFLAYVKLIDQTQIALTRKQNELKDIQ